ncbi:hypothetical protein [Arcobacter arenosus]|jgi:hypothetical protein|uniref:hypothetical protein n=1 Tax=Arcobacter arenosus TaxID=2576037 RepID=UPI003BAC6A0C
MTKQQEIIERIYDHVENDDVDKAVFACLRLSRSIGDVFNTLLFLKELHPDKKQSDQAFYEEVKDLKKEAQKFLWKIVGEHWLDGRTLDYSVTDDPDKTVLILGVGVMQKEKHHINETISDLKTPNGMTEYDLAAFTDRYDSTKSQFRLRLSGVNTILDRIRTRCLNYASRIEHQIASQEKANSFLMDVQNSVNTYFYTRSENTYIKLQKATDLLGSKNSEDNALLLTAIRRAINSIADYFYPPVESEVMCVDGVTRKMGNEQYLNRLHEFVMQSFKSSTSRELIKAELDYLMVFTRKLNDIASKGVHSEVSESEAKQGLVGLYLFLSNIIEKLEHNSS